MHTDIYNYIFFQQFLGNVTEKGKVVRAVAVCSHHTYSSLSLLLLLLLILRFALLEFSFIFLARLLPRLFGPCTTRGLSRYWAFRPSLLFCFYLTSAAAFFFLSFFLSIAVLNLCDVIVVAAQAIERHLKGGGVLLVLPQFSFTFFLHMILAYLSPYYHHLCCYSKTRLCCRHPAQDAKGFSHVSIAMGLPPCSHRHYALCAGHSDNISR